MPTALRQMRPPAAGLLEAFLGGPNLRGRMAKSRELPATGPVVVSVLPLLLAYWTLRWDRWPRTPRLLTPLYWMDDSGVSQRRHRQQ